MTDRKYFLYLFLSHLMRGKKDPSFSSVKFQHYVFLYSEYVKQQKEKRDTFLPIRHLYHFAPSKNGVSSYTLMEDMRAHPLVDFVYTSSVDHYSFKEEVDTQNLEMFDEKWKEGIDFFMDHIVECSWEDIVISIYKKYPFMCMYADLIINYLLPPEDATVVCETKKRYEEVYPIYNEDYYCYNTDIEELIVFLIVNNIDYVVDMRDKARTYYKPGFSRQRMMQQIFSKIDTLYFTDINNNDIPEKGRGVNLLYLKDK